MAVCPSQRPAQISRVRRLLFNQERHPSPRFQKRLPLVIAAIQFLRFNSRMYRMQQHARAIQFPGATLAPVELISLSLLLRTYGDPIITQLFRSIAEGHRHPFGCFQSISPRTPPTSLGVQSTSRKDGTCSTHGLRYPVIVAENTSPSQHHCMWRTGRTLVVLDHPTPPPIPIHTLVLVTSLGSLLVQSPPPVY